MERLNPSRKKGGGWSLVWFCMVLERPRAQAWCERASHDRCQWVRQDPLGRLVDYAFAAPLKRNE